MRQTRASLTAKSASRVALTALAAIFITGVFVGARNTASPILAFDANAAAPQKDHEEPHAKPKDVVVTGCLYKRDRPGDFALTTRDAKLFYAQSTNVDLAAHAGHMVTLTGTFVPNSQTKDDPDKAPEAPTIDVTKLEMLSKNCH